MKNIIFSVALITFVMTSCNQKNRDMDTNNSEAMHHDSTMVDHDSKTMESDSKMYACPMHPEVIGKKGDKCTKCGMDLTEEVTK
ncbi:heavy metal-binding domain-containing protein [Flavobacterium enshiense]|uniref:heavy metal-binding domain-containing protein n=1 Tax=Flavobacterium enshiense TaxID=1341165 RepID=UPI000AB35761|nr:heavy metal-binding domain-containing protein [Flavobacterium enshiense]